MRPGTYTKTGLGMNLGQARAIGGKKSVAQSHYLVHENSDHLTCYLVFVLHLDPKTRLHTASLDENFVVGQLAVGLRYCSIASSESYSCGIRVSTILAKQQAGDCS